MEWKPPVYLFPIPSFFLLSKRLMTILNLTCSSPVPRQRSLQPEVNEIHNEDILKQYDLILEVSKMPWLITTDPQDSRQFHITPVLTEDGQQIFAENSAAQGQKNHVTSKSSFPFVRWLKSTDRIYSVTRGSIMQWVETGAWSCCCCIMTLGKLLYLPHISVMSSIKWRW